MSSGTLTIVGTGFMVAGQITPEAEAYIGRADRLLYLGGDPATRRYLEGLNPTCESLYDAYRVGGDRRSAYAEMTERMLQPVREGKDVCAAFYGHPGVFVDPAHDAIRQAKAEGLRATMLPAVSAEDCLFADLGVDPAEHGCQSWEATAFLIWRPAFDPRSSLILWQIGGVGVTTYEREALWSQSGLEVLAETLTGTYPEEHEVVVYNASVFPMLDPSIVRVSLKDLPSARVDTRSTLYVPPRESADPDLELRVRIGLPPRSDRAKERPELGTMGSTAPGREGGSLTVVGTGYQVAGQVTPEARAHMQAADRVYYLLSDPATAAYVRTLNPDTVSLHDSYWEGRNGLEASNEMAERILEGVRRGLNVCAAFYGHPAIFVPPSHEAIRRAREEGFAARMLPAVSAADCMFAELGFDPGKRGCQLFEATDFLVNRRVIDTTVPVILLQVGAVGTFEYHARREGDVDNFAVLLEHLRNLYPPDHPVTLYEKAQLPTAVSRIESSPLDRIHEATLTVYTTMYIPPAGEPSVSEEMAARLGLEAHVARSLAD